MKRNLHRKTQNMLENLAKVFDTMETSKNSKNRDNQQGQIIITFDKDENPKYIEGVREDLIKYLNLMPSAIVIRNKPSETTNEQPNDMLPTEMVISIINGLNSSIMDGFDHDDWEKLVKYCDDNAIVLGSMPYTDIINMFSETTKWNTLRKDILMSFHSKESYEKYANKFDDSGFETEVTELNLLGQVVDNYLI